MEMDDGRRWDRTAEWEPSAPMREVPVADRGREGEVVLWKCAIRVWCVGWLIEVRV